MNEWIDGQEDTSRDERYVRRAFQDDRLSNEEGKVGRDGDNGDDDDRRRRRRR